MQPELPCKCVPARTGTNAREQPHQH
jgi:hypothetical protein